MTILSEKGMERQAELVNVLRNLADDIEKGEKMILVPANFSVTESTLNFSMVEQRYLIDISVVDKK